MGYTLAEHRHRFAVWAAARAAQRGFTSVEELRRALQATDIRRVLSSDETRNISASAFDVLHQRWCSEIRASMTKRRIKGVTHGRAAKLVAVYLKATVIMGPDWDSPLGRNLHPPIDRILLKGLAACDDFPSSYKAAKAAWGKINWTQLNETPYYELIGQLRKALPEGEPFWTLEKYWQPSRDDGTD